MGVKNLWQIFGPYGHKISLVELQKKQVAVDVSCWICANQTLGERNKSYFPKLHLRNIFFRTAILLSANITPLFVMDGDPPEIKSSTLSKRRKLRVFNKNQDVSKEGNPKNSNIVRKMHKYALNECQELVNFLGLPCLWSCGEGEALCALLDQKGIVDGIITQDSDAFLYGARKIYRNLTIQTGFGTVDIFEMSDIEKNLNLTKEKLIAMSILCGCDYETGVHGIGPEKSLKYLSNYEGDVLSRLQHLKFDKELSGFYAEKNGCKKCHHSGKLSLHAKLGCTSCGTQSKCVQSDNCSYYSLSVTEKTRVDFELEVRHKTISDPAFPNMATITEYLNFSQELPETEFKWLEPDVLGFIFFMEEKCNWPRIYGFQKIIPLYCRWALLNSKFRKVNPVQILKKRVYKGVPSFDVEWKVKKNLFLCTGYKSYINNGLITTIEPETLIMDKCKDLYAQFFSEEREKLSRKGEKKRGDKKKKTKGDVDSLIGSINQLSVNEKSTKSTNNTDKCNKLDWEMNFSETRHSRSISADKPSEKYNFERNSSYESENSVNFSLNDSATVDYDINDYKINESLILDNIIARRQYY